jgi:hypothetical protein
MLKPPIKGSRLRLVASAVRRKKNNKPKTSYQILKDEILSVLELAGENFMSVESIRSDLKRRDILVTDYAVRNRVVGDKKEIEEIKWPGNRRGYRLIKNRPKNITSPGAAGPDYSVEMRDMIRSASKIMSDLTKFLDDYNEYCEIKKDGPDPLFKTILLEVSFLAQSTTGFLPKFLGFLSGTLVDPEIIFELFPVYILRQFDKLLERVPLISECLERQLNCRWNKTHRNEHAPGLFGDQVSGILSGKPEDGGLARSLYRFNFDLGVRAALKVYPDDPSELRDALCHGLTTGTSHRIVQEINLERNPFFRKYLAHDWTEE